MDLDALIPSVPTTAQTVYRDSLEVDELTKEVVWTLTNVSIHFSVILMLNVQILQAASSVELAIPDILEVDSQAAQITTSAYNPMHAIHLQHATTPMEVTFVLHVHSDILAMEKRDVWISTNA